MKEVNAKFRYRGYDIYTQNGEYTVGCSDNCSFDDCTLENFYPVDEYQATRWLMEKGYKVKFHCFGSNDYVSYEKYLEHLMAYDWKDKYNYKDINDLSNNLTVPEMHLSSIKEAKEFIDWVEDESDKYIIPELRRKRSVRL